VRLNVRIYGYLFDRPVSGEAGRVDRPIIAAPAQAPT